MPTVHLRVRRILRYSRGLGLVAAAATVLLALAWSRLVLVVVRVRRSRNSMLIRVVLGKLPTVLLGMALLHWARVVLRVVPSLVAAVVLGFAALVAPPVCLCASPSEHLVHELVVSHLLHCLEILQVIFLLVEFVLVFDDLANRKVLLGILPFFSFVVFLPLLILLAIEVADMEDVLQSLWNRQVGSAGFSEGRLLAVGCEVGEVAQAGLVLIRLISRQPFFLLQQVYDFKQ